ncbi:hypothetical protein Tco_0109495 [Tanacetum coccineum]
MSEPMPSIPTQSPFTYPNPNPSASPSFHRSNATSDSFIPEPTQPILHTLTCFPSQHWLSPNPTEPILSFTTSVQIHSPSQTKTLTIVQSPPFQTQGNSPKRLGKMQKEIQFVLHSSPSLDEHVSYKGRDKNSSVTEKKPNKRVMKVSSEDSEPAESNNDQESSKMIYEDFDQLIRLEMEEMDLSGRWLMSLLED